MKKFQLIDEHLVEKIYDHLKSFDKFDKLSIRVEEIDIAQVVLTIEIDEDFRKREMLPHCDGVLGIPETIESKIDYLSRQVKFFEDVEDLLGSKLFRKTYRANSDRWALGETVLDGVKYEFSISSNALQKCQISIEFEQIIDGLKHESRISTNDWFDYDDLEQTWSKFKKIVDR